MKHWKMCEGCNLDGICKNQKEGRKCKAVKRFKRGIKNDRS